MCSKCSTSDYIGGSTKAKKSSAWIDHIRKFAKDNNISFSCALSNPQCSIEYRENKNKPITKTLKNNNVNVESPTKEITISRKEFEDNREKAGRHLRRESAALRRSVRQIINSQTKPDSLDIIRDILHARINITPYDNLAKVWKSFNFKEELPKQKERQVTTILQKFKSRIKMTDLLSKISKEVETKDRFIVPRYKKQKAVI
jgi:hypothetical protein